jgi:hypothetical protein
MDFVDPASTEYAMWGALLARMSCQSDVTYPSNDVGAGESTGFSTCLIWAADFWQSKLYHQWALPEIRKLAV